MIYHSKDFPIEADRVQASWLGNISGWPEWVAGQIKIEGMAGNNESGTASLMDGTPIYEGDYLIKNEDGSLLLGRKADIDSRYETAS